MFLAQPYYSQRPVFASPPSAFFLCVSCLSGPQENSKSCPQMLIKDFGGDPTDPDHNAVTGIVNGMFTSAR